MLKFLYHNVTKANITPHILEEVHSNSKLLTENIKAKDGRYKIFDCDNSLKQQLQLQNIVKYIQDNFAHIIVVGMGGAILNSHQLVNMVGTNKDMHFVDNTDPHYLQKILHQITPQKTAIISISNSGETIETVSVTKTLIKYFEDTEIKQIGENFFAITNPNSGKLQQIMKKIGAHIIHHQADISGRFSGLTNVSTLVASIAGIDIEEYLQGAKDAINSFLQSPHEVSEHVALLLSMPHKMIVNLGYLQKLDKFLEWYCQIIAESTGKDGKGFTPLRGLGPNDQHSMLQLYLSGPDDKFYNLLQIKNTPPNLLDNLHYLHNINNANFSATSQALIEQKRPIREIICDEMNARSAGYLIAHMMIEAILLCMAMNINPFNQPGVELIKKNLRDIVD